MRTSENQATATIDLAKPRIIAFKANKRQYTLTLKPITEKLWLRYFAGIVSVQETVNGDLASSYDSSGSRLELLESVLTDATGYTKPGEALPEGWQSKLPIAHRRAAGDLLTEVLQDAAHVDDEDFFPPLGTETVTLKAVCSANEAGKMQQVSGLRHSFHSPTSEHQKRYSRAMSRSVVVGGSRTGKTRWLGAQDVLIEIYDELIVSVEGYTFNGEPLVDLKQMDAYHKVAAATVLFAPIEVAEEEPKK